MKALRFQPPNVEFTSELVWVLHRAFGPPELPVDPPADPDTAWYLADRLDLAGRIAVRSSPEQLDSEVGQLADAFRDASRLAAAATLRHQIALRQVATAAASLGIPLIVLKGGALALLGVSPPGARQFCDLDLLMPKERIDDLRNALLGTGWQGSTSPSDLHHAPPLKHPTLGTIELHHCIPGVRMPGSSEPLGARALLDSGYVDSRPKLGPSIEVPSTDLLIAHALVHALVQHGWSPGGYPFFRLLCDLQDLGADIDRILEAGRFLEDFDEDDLVATARLLVALEAGRAIGLPRGGSRSLLHHLLAAQFDALYADCLGFELLENRAGSKASLPVFYFRRAWKRHTTRRPSINAVDGPPRSSGGSAARQLLRVAINAARFGRFLLVRPFMSRRVVQPGSDSHDRHS